MGRDGLRRLISIILLFGLLVVFSVTTKNFLNTQNIISIMRESSVIGIIAVGVTLVIITAGIDLSTGAIVGLSAMISAHLIYSFDIPPILIYVTTIGVGILVGVINGLLIACLKIPDFIATLSTQFILQALVLVFAIKENGAIVNKVIHNRGILILGGSVNGIYLVTIMFIIVTVLGQVFLKKTRPGIYVYATGANRKSAELSGISTGKIKILVYTITGLLCGIAGLFTMGRVGSVTTDTGVGMEFDVISAVVIGGCAFSGGRGDVVGSMIGAVFLATLQNGILKYNFPTATQLIVKGIVIVLMIIFDTIYNQIMEKRIHVKMNVEENEHGGVA